MVRVRVSVTGASEAAAELNALADRFEGSLRPLLGPIGEAFASGIQDRIRLGAVPLPPELPQTAAIRRYYGHADKQRLVRGGDLLRSIRTLEVGDSFVAVGSDLEAAVILSEGGTNKTGQQVRPHPFLGIPNEELNDAVDTLLDFIVGEA